MHHPVRKKGAPTDRATDRSTDRPKEQLNDRPNASPTKRLKDRPTDRSTDRPTNRPIESDTDNNQPHFMHYTFEPHLGAPTKRLRSVTRWHPVATCSRRRVGLPKPSPPKPIFFITSSPGITCRRTFDQPMSLANGNRQGCRHRHKLTCWGYFAHPSMCDVIDMLSLLQTVYHTVEATTDPSLVYPHNYT